MPDGIFRDQHHLWLTMANSLHGTTHKHQATLENSQPFWDSQQYKKYHVPVPLTKAQFTQQPALDTQMHGLTPQKLPGLIQQVPHLIPSTPYPKPQLTAPMQNNLVPLAVMIYILLVLKPSNTRTAAQHINPPTTWHWSSSWLHPASAVQTQKSCSCRTMAIIQWLWDTTWDITTHWNVECCPPGFGQPTTKRTANCYLLPSHRTPSLQIALISTIHWQPSQFCNPLGYQEIQFNGRQ